jgi:hypothetical protein
MEFFEAQKALHGLLGKPCCRRRVGRSRSLALGFGERLVHSKTHLPDTFYGEWELGSYTASWRVLRGQRVVCGSNDAVASIEELNARIQGIDIGSVTALRMLSTLDVRVELDTGLSVDFLDATSDDDESFHVFGPEHLYVEFSQATGWKVGVSNRPWG